MILVRIWREADGFRMDLKPAPGSKPPEELLRPPFATAHEARQAFKTVQGLIARARVVVLESRPDDAEDF